MKTAPGRYASDGELNSSQRIIHCSSGSRAAQFHGVLHNQNTILHVRGVSCCDDNSPVSFRITAQCKLPIWKPVHMWLWYISIWSWWCGLEKETWRWLYFEGRFPNERWFLLQWLPETSTKMLLQCHSCMKSENIMHMCKYMYIYRER